MTRTNVNSNNRAPSCEGCQPDRHDPDLRIALCGFDGEHDMPDEWRCATWQSTSSAKSRHQERIWFSPHCLDASGRQGDLFAEASA